MNFRGIIAMAAIACITLGSGCTTYRSIHGCGTPACGSACNSCDQGLRKAKCGSHGCSDCGPLFNSHAGKYYQSCDGCGDADCDVGVEPSCGAAIEPGCGVVASGCSSCKRPGISCWQPGALLREIFSCDGCTGPTYWNEWYNDPPNCCESCDHFGNYTGPTGYSTVAHRGTVQHSVASPTTVDPYYDGKIIEQHEAPPTPAKPTAPKPRETRLQSRVVPTGFVTPVEPSCNCK